MCDSFLGCMADTDFQIGMVVLFVGIAMGIGIALVIVDAVRTNIMHRRWIKEDAAAKRGAR